MGGASRRAFEPAIGRLADRRAAEREKSARCGRMGLDGE
jgi:hypothetical protein